MLKYTTEQLEVINHNISQHAIVSAVAGSGKTQTLIGRIEYLISQNINPAKILIVMFNKSAAIDFESRSNKILGQNLTKLLNIKTFHSLGFKILKEMEKNKLIDTFNLVTQDFKIQIEIKKAVAQAQKKLNLYDEITADKIEQFSRYLSLIKSEINNIEDMLFFKSLPRKKKELVKTFYAIYESGRKQNKFITFDDLIYLPCSAFSKDNSLCESFNFKYEHIIVDEYQDINHAQQMLLKTIAGSHAFVMVVGDVDQTIYEWRGSNPYYMLEGFMRDFKNAILYNLSVTFRYSHILSLVANEIISNNNMRHKQISLSASNIGFDTKIDIFSRSDIEKIVIKIKDALKSKEYLAKDIGVLVRKYSSSVLFELTCLKMQLPYSIVGSGGVFDLGIVKVICGHLMLTCNADFLKDYDNFSKEKYIQAMLIYANLYLTSSQLKTLTHKLMKDPASGFNIFLEFTKSNTIPEYKKKLIIDYAQCWNKIYNLDKNLMAYDAIIKIENILQLKAYLNKKATNHYMFSEYEVYEEFSLFIASYCKSLIDFNFIIKDLIDTANTDKSSEQNSNKIQICSIHRAKGLQWRKLVLCDMTERSFFGLDKSPPLKTIESERRLFYVAITRAVEHLIIIGGDDIFPLNEWLDTASGSYPSSLNGLSSVRFLYESRLNSCTYFLNHFDDENTKKISKIKNNKYMLSYQKHLIDDL